jgi:UDP-glucose 4-epimerase
MRILVVGADGFIGAHCVAHLRRAGHEVWTASRTERIDDRHLVLSHTEAGYERLFAGRDYDACVNAAGSASVPRSFEDPAADFEANVLTVQRLLVALRAHNPRCALLNFSSAAVYGNPRRLPVRESAPPAPVSPYGFHKLQSEYLLREYHQLFGLRTCSLRVFSAYGPGLRKQLFWDLYQRSRACPHLELFGTGEETRDFIFIDDLLRALDLILVHGRFEGEAVNVASGTEVTVRVAVRTFLGLLDPGLSYAFSGAAKAGDPANWCASVHTIARMGFVPAIPLEEGLARCVQWLKGLK